MTGERTNIPLLQGKAALLLLDWEECIFQGFADHAEGRKARANAGALLKAARQAGIFTLYVKVGFRPGAPSVSPENPVFWQHAQSRTAEIGNPEAAILPELAPLGEEPVVIKHRVSPFFGTDLEMILRAQNIKTLILSGIVTSGVVLSTAKDGFDRDYNIVIAADACADTTPQTHEAVLKYAFHWQNIAMPSTEALLRIIKG